jgi:hypothetical protein
MLTLLALLWVTTPAQVGSIHILVEPGDAIFLDGRQVGISSNAMGGFLIESVPTGEHEVMIKTPSGGGVTKKVTVYVAQTSVITISSLGLRTRSRGDDATVEVQALSGGGNCELVAGPERITGPADDLRLERIRPGSQTVTVTCGDKKARGEIDVPPGKIVTVAVDFTTSKLKIVNERNRIVAVYVPTVEDYIMRLDLPFSWKRAVAATLVAGVKPTSISRQGMVQLAVTYTGPNYSSIEEVAGRLKDRKEVKSVYLRDYDSGYYRNNKAAEMSFIITFENSQ